MKKLSNSFYYLVSFFTVSILSFSDVLAVEYNQSTSTTSAWASATVGDVEAQGNVIIWNFLNIIYFLITLYVFYWAFNILTASWDEEKVKKWRTIITHALIWFIVVFLTWSIVKFIFTSITT
jgi:hypothetical protein